MKSMNLFGDTKSKETINQLPSAPIQDEDGNLTFELDGKTYFLNVNSEWERKRVKAEVNANSLAKYDWFKEETGEKHWVFYNTKMYEICNFYLHYKEDSVLAPIIPINATSCCRMFHDYEELTQLNLSNFNTSQITDMSGMFRKCEALTELDLSNFDTSQVIDMSHMFEYCESLTQIDLSNFDTSQVTNMSSMFYCCEVITKLNLSNFDTSQVINMSYMFEYCESLTQLDLSNFNTSKVTDMRDMFYNCKALSTIYISDKWNIDKVKLSDEMFMYCNSLPNFNPEEVEIEMAKPIEQGGYLTLKR